MITVGRPVCSLGSAPRIAAGTRPVLPRADASSPRQFKRGPIHWLPTLAEYRGRRPDPHAPDLWLAIAQDRRTHPPEPALTPTLPSPRSDVRPPSPRLLAGPGPGDPRQPRRIPLAAARSCATATSAPTDHPLWPHFHTRSRYCRLRSAPTHSLTFMIWVHDP